MVSAQHCTHLTRGGCEGPQSCAWLWGRGAETKAFFSFIVIIYYGVIAVLAESETIAIKDAESAQAETETTLRE